MITTESLARQFSEVYQEQCTLLARAPGRINLIGEHTDYNGGFVLPAAIEYEIRMAARLTDSTTIRLHSVNYHDDYQFGTSGDLPRPEKTEWYSYFLAVVHQFQQRGIAVPGMDIAINGDVPLGAGLSSSAAFEVCAATLINHVTSAGLDRKEIALLSQAAEHSDFVGVRCGIMDQFASALGEKSSALFIDCHSLDFETLPFDPTGALIVIINSNKQRDLRTSEFNARRQECEEGLRLLTELEQED